MQCKFWEPNWHCSPNRLHSIITSSLTSILGFLPQKTDEFFQRFFICFSPKKAEEMPRPGTAIRNSGNSFGHRLTGNMQMENKLSEHWKIWLDSNTLMESHGGKNCLFEFMEQQSDPVRVMYRGSLCLCGWKRWNQIWQSTPGTATASHRKTFI